MSETCMCWGICVDSGWLKLIDTLCEEIAQHVETENTYGDTGKTLHFEAVQVKEKFGGLRFYYDGGDERISGMVNMAQAMSFNICETCGNAGQLYRRKGGFWIKTLCPACAEKEGFAKVENNKEYKVI